MNTNKRVELLTAFKVARDKGLTMTEGRFTAQDVSNLEGMIERQPGPSGIYCITEDGLKYLALKQLGQELVAA